MPPLCSPWSQTNGKICYPANREDKKQWMICTIKGENKNQKQYISFPLPFLQPEVTPMATLTAKQYGKCSSAQDEKEKICHNNLMP